MKKPTHITRPETFPVRVLALDLGTRTGYAKIDAQGLQVGTATLASAKELTGSMKWRDWDIRFTRLAAFVVDWFMEEPSDEPVHIVWEDVQFVHSSQQINVWTTLRSAVWAATWFVRWRFSTASVTLHAVPVGTLKKFATGSGAAGKDGMLRAAVAQKKLTPEQADALDDNAVDALWLMHYATENLVK